MTDQLPPPADVTDVPAAATPPSVAAPTGPPPPRPPTTNPSPTGGGADSGIWILVAGVATVAIVVALLFRAFVNPVPVAAPSPSTTPAATAAPSASAIQPLSPSPSPKASASPSPSPSPSPSASAAPTTGPTEGPTPTSGPTTAPTSAPTAAPTATAPPAQTTSCPQPNTGVTVVYPSDWYTVDEPPQYACAFFASAPIVIPPDQTFPDAPVAVLADETPYQEALAALTDPTKWTTVSQSSAKVSGLPATVAETSWIGKAPYTVGTQRYFYLVDRGAAGSVLFVTQGQAGAAYDQDKQVVDLMASKSSISPPK
jgi:hypothetical protein